MTSQVRRSIAVYEVLTFLGALLDIVAAIIASRSRPPGFYIVAAIALLAAGMSLLAGVRLWNDRPGARRLSIIVQLFQIPHVAIEGVVAYTVALGLSIIIRMGHEPEVMRPPVHLFLHLGTGAHGYFVGINILAAAAAVLLLRRQPATTREAPAVAEAQPVAGPESHAPSA